MHCTTGWAHESLEGWPQKLRPLGSRDVLIHLHGLPPGGQPHQVLALVQLLQKDGLAKRFQTVDDLLEVLPCITVVEHDSQVRASNALNETAYPWSS